MPTTLVSYRVLGVFRHNKHGHRTDKASEDSQGSQTTESPRSSTSKKVVEEPVPVKEPALPPPEMDEKPKEKMPLYAGLEQFKLVEKMGEYVIFSAASFADHGLQWCIFQRIQGHRHYISQASCR